MTEILGAGVEVFVGERSIGSTGVHGGRHDVTTAQERGECDASEDLNDRDHNGGYVRVLTDEEVAPWMKSVCERSS